MILPNPSEHQFQPKPEPVTSLGSDSSSNSSSLDLDLLREKSRDSLYFFAKGILRFSWLQPHIHHSVTNLLAKRKATRKLVVLPRGWLKTTLCSQAYPIWRAVHDPNIRILLAQNNLTNARAKLRVVREQFERNQLLRAMYPHVLPNSNSTWSADSLCLNRSESFPESTFECIGVKGQPTSRHYNIIIEDDTVAPDFDELGEETLAPTHEDVRKAIAWHKLAMPLLTDPGSDEIIIVGTRWYEHDLISYILDSENSFEHIFRACREDNEGKPDPKGHVTYPERFDADVLREYEQTLGPYFFSTLMLNSPVNLGDMPFRAEWFKEYEQIPSRRSLHVFTTIDAATDPQLSTGNATNLDYSTVMTCGKDVISGNIYVLDYFRARCSPGEHAAALFEHVIKWRPIQVGYEDVAYQKSLDYWLKELMRQRQEYFILVPIKRTGRKSKETYIMGLTPIAASGAIHIRSYMSELLTEFLAFPRGSHDDLIDSMAMQTSMWKRTRSLYEVRSAQLDPNNFDLESVIAEIRQKKRMGTSRDSIIHDPGRSASTAQPLNANAFFNN